MSTEIKSLPQEALASSSHLGLISGSRSEASPDTTKLVQIISCKAARIIQSYSPGGANVHPV